MLRHTRLVLTAAAGLMAVLVIVLSVRQLGRYDRQRSAGAEVPAPLAVGTALQRPKPVPAMHLVDDRGNPFSTTQWRGKWVVLAPSLTLCHEVCPMTTAALNEVKQLVGERRLGDQVTVAEVTADPWRDSPARLRAYRRLSRASFQLLTGTQAEIKRIWKFFGVYYARVPQAKPPDVDWMTGKPETFDVDHTNGMFIIDPAGQERIVDEGMPDVGGRLPAGLRRLLCGPCRAEFSLFAVAAARYGRRVAFLGYDTNDSAADARKFLSQHPVSYPSYQGSQSALSSLAQIAGLPTTIFVGPSGKVVYVHTGSYDTQTTLEQDIQRYALGA